MTKQASTIPEILAGCEANSLAPAYTCDPEGHTVVAYDAQGRDVYVVSDLHVAAGRGPDGNFTGTENFFADDSFARFLQDLRSQKKGLVLVINGDFVDFLRVDRRPISDADYASWEEALARIGIPRSIEDLRASISSKEKTYGLKTDDYKSVWKLLCSVNGHPQLFEALAAWVCGGEQLVIVKGNHDLEWYWPAVRNFLRLVIADRAARLLRRPVDTVLRSIVLPNICFVDDALLVDNQIYIEHGHRYDKFSKVIGGPVLGNGTELNLPFGSFFNRYLINQIELVYPFIDNVRPREKLLPLLVREHFPLALRVLFDHIPFALLSIQKRYYWYMLSRAAVYALAIGIPVVFVLIRYWTDINALIDTLHGPTATGIPGLLLDQLSRFAQSSIALVFSYLLARLVAFFQLDEPVSLASFATPCFETSPGCRFVTFGHTHDPEQFHEQVHWYHNTGTWIPIIDVDSAEIREDKTYTFLSYRREPDGSFGSTTLQRWDDEAGRAQRLVLLTRKDHPKSESY